MEFWSLKIDKITVQNQILSVKHLKEIFFEQFPKKLFVFSTQKIKTAKKYGTLFPKLISLLLYIDYSLTKFVETGWPCHCQLIWDYILILRFDFWHQKNVRRPIHPWILRLFSKIYNWRRDIGCFVSSLKSFISFFFVWNWRNFCGHYFKNIHVFRAAFGWQQKKNLDCSSQ